MRNKNLLYATIILILTFTTMSCKKEYKCTCKNKASITVDMQDYAHSKFKDAKSQCDKLQNINKESDSTVTCTLEETGK